jgi:hypothetical protein
MSLDDYLEKRRRNQAKKQLRLTKPYLMGAQLDQEVDRVLGVSDSEGMDWVSILKTEVSDYPTPESVIDKVEKIANEFGLHPWALYWNFNKKVLKLESSGRKKSNYLALLKEIASSDKKLTETEKIQAICLFSKEVLKEDPPLTRSQAEVIIIQKGW